MRKHWVALLSVLGLAGSGVRVESQVLKGSKPPATNETVKPGSTAQKTANSGKLQVNQQTLRQQNPNGAVANKPSGTKAVAQNTGTCRYSEGCQTQKNQALTKSNQQLTKGNQQLTPPPPGQAGANNQLTKGNNQAITKGNQQLTKGNNQAITKGSNQAITKGSNQAITKGNQQLTKGTQAVPK